jgi:hypothetical protein
MAESFRFDGLWALNPGAMLDHLPSLGRESVRQKGVLLNNGQLNNLLTNQDDHVIDKIV